MIARRRRSRALTRRIASSMCRLLSAAAETRRSYCRLAIAMSYMDSIGSTPIPLPEATPAWSRVSSPNPALPLPERTSGDPASAKSFDLLDLLDRSVSFDPPHLRRRPAPPDCATAVWRTPPRPSRDSRIGPQRLRYGTCGRIHACSFDWGLPRSRLDPVRRLVRESVLLSAHRFSDGLLAVRGVVDVSSDPEPTIRRERPFQIGTVAWVRLVDSRCDQRVRARRARTGSLQGSCFIGPRLLVRVMVFSCVGTDNQCRLRLRTTSIIPATGPAARRIERCHSLEFRKAPQVRSPRVYSCMSPACFNERKPCFDTIR